MRPGGFARPKSLGLARATKLGAAATDDCSVSVEGGDFFS